MTASEENKALVRAVFGPWEAGDAGPFLDLIAEDVTWTVRGSTPVSGVYHAKQDLVEGAFKPLLSRLEGPLKTRLVDVAADGEKVYLRFHGSGLAKSGLHYEQDYCFAMIMREGRIVEIVSYVDTELLTKLFS
ncbi:MAG: nuclear transport factor 2 family protein [Kiloniellales bacterium]